MAQHRKSKGNIWSLSGGAEALCQLCGPVQHHWQYAFDTEGKCSVSYRYLVLPSGS